MEAQTLTLPTTANGKMKPPSSYKNEPNGGPSMYPTPINISVYDIKVATLSGNKSIKIDSDAPQTVASAKPCKNLKHSQCLI